MLTSSICPLALDTQMSNVSLVARQPHSTRQKMSEFWVDGTKAIRLPCVSEQEKRKTTRRIICGHGVQIYIMYTVCTSRYGKRNVKVTSYRFTANSLQKRE
jgi:hypothetical protein